MNDEKNKSTKRHTDAPSLDDIRRAHHAESERISSAIKDGTVDELQPGGSIFQRDLTLEELQEKQRKRLEANAALRVFFKICEKWNLDEAQIFCFLGNPGKKVYEDYRCGTVWTLPNDTMMRISYVIGIYKALRTLFPTEDQASAWIKKSNRHFEGRAALDVMLDGDLATVRRYLDGQCQ